MARKERVTMVMLPEEATIKQESDLINIIGDKSSTVGGEIFLYPFQGRGEATLDLYEELDELENLFRQWKINFGKKGICKVLPCNKKRK